MARMPGAIWKPLAADWDRQPRMRAYDFFCLHTMVGGLDGTDGYFRNKNGAGYGGTESHFGVGPDGTIFQWQDTDFQADANGNGNWHVISSENADTGGPFPKWGGSDVPAMTPQQVEANAQIAAWLYRTHGIPLDLTPDSKPGRRGLAVHRWGVPGYMVASAEQWSTARGKACPGDRRVAQAPLVSARAKQIVAGQATPSVPVTVPAQEAEMLHQLSLSNPNGDTPDQSFLLLVDPVGDSLVLPKGAQAFLQWAAFFPPAPGQGAASTDKARLDWLVYRKVQGDVPVNGRDLKHRDRSGVSPLPAGTREVEGRVLGIPKGGVFTVQVSAIGRAA